MNRSRSFTAIKVLLIAVLLPIVAPAWAQEATGFVMQVSGPLLVRKAGGMQKILAVASRVEPGDRLETSKLGFVRVRFGDASELILGPDTTLIVDTLSFNAQRTDANEAAFTLVKGALRSSVNSLIARNPERYWLNTPSGRIDIGNATFDAHVLQPSGEDRLVSRPYLLASAAALSPSPIISDADRAGAGLFPLQIAQALPGIGGGLAPGLYVHVIDGLIQLSNRGGVQQFAAGQFGFTGNVMQPPVVVPTNPGIKFTPPPAFSSSSPTGSIAGSGGSKPQAVDCEVR